MPMPMPMPGKSSSGGAKGEASRATPAPVIVLSTGAPLAPVEDTAVVLDLGVGQMALEGVTIPVRRPEPMRRGERKAPGMAGAAPGKPESAPVVAKAAPVVAVAPGGASPSAVGVAEPGMTGDTPLPVFEAPGALAGRILDAAYQMSVVQAMNPRAKDDYGFSNADYGLGGVAAMMGDVSACALLLTLYPRQAASYGLDRDELRKGMPEEWAQAPVRSAAFALLRARREDMRGVACWAEMDKDSIFVMTYAQDWEESLPFRRHGTRTTTGYIIPRDHLPQLLTECTGRIAQREKLEEIAQEVKEAQRVRPDLAAHAAAIGVTASRQPDGAYLVKWTNPFSPVGTEFRDMVKARLGAAFQGESKAWRMSERAARMLPLVAAGMDADFSEYPFRGNHLRGNDLVVAENLRMGVSTLEVVQVKGDDLVFSFEGRNQDLGGVIKAKGGAWRNGAHEIPLDQVMALLDAVDERSDVDASGLLDTALAAMRKKASVVSRVIALNERADQVPSTTPTGIALFPHQKEGYRLLWSAPTRGVVLGDDMGLGKTLAALMYIHDRFRGERVIVVPPSSLKRNWEREATRFLGQSFAAGIQVIRTGADKIRPDATMVIINYDQIAKRKDELMAWRPSLLVLDEAHRIKGKNATAAWSKALLGYTVKPKDPRDQWKHVSGIISVAGASLMLTGTPIQNRPEELWNYLLVAIGEPKLIAAFLKLHEPIPGDPVSREPNFLGFAKRYCAAEQVRVGIDKWVWDTSGSSNLEDLGARMAPFYFRRTKTQLQEQGLLGDFKGKLPQQSIPVELTPAERKTYNAAVAKMLGNLESLLEADLEGVDLDFLDRRIRGSKKVEDGVLAEASALRQVTALMKIPAAIEQVRTVLDGGGKIIVFSNYLAVLNALEEEFRKPIKDDEGNEIAPFGIARVDGSVTSDRRDVEQQRFQNDPGVRIFLGQTRAAGEGLNLTAADTVLTVDRPWKPGEEDQCEDRANRIGQTKIVTCLYTDAEGTFDDQIREVLAVKRASIAAFEKGAAEATRVTDTDALRGALLALRDATRGMKTRKTKKK